MKVAPVYRSVLKNLKRACTTRPHFVQDVRFLLSLPLFTANEEHTVVPGTTNTTTTTSATRQPAPSVPATETTMTENVAAPPTPAPRTTPKNYLNRPASGCYPIATTTLFNLCYADLQSALRQPTQTESGVNPVAQQVVRYRNLLWLKGRLERILSEKTTQQLATSLNVSEGPTDDGFIPDAFFEEEVEKQIRDADVRGGSSARSSTEKDTATAAASSPSSTTGDSSGGTARGARFDSVASAAIDETNADVVYSAGAIGLHCEMFVLNHRESFPMAAHFLAGFPTVPASELASCAHQQAALVRLVRERYSTTVTCEDAYVSLSVAVELHDLHYRTREHAGVGFFATAHRVFRVHMSVEPLSLGEAGVAERTEVLIVNSYFVRLDMEVMEVVEQVGYLASRDVLRMLRERDGDDVYDDFIGSTVAETLGEGELKEGKTTAPADSAAPNTAPSMTSKGHSFSLCFLNPTDAPIVLKGMLYYKVGKRRELATAPIRCIPFGSVLLEA